MHNQKDVIAYCVEQLYQTIIDKQFQLPIFVAACQFKNVVLVQVLHQHKLIALVDKLNYLHSYFFCVDILQFLVEHQYIKLQNRLDHLFNAWETKLKFVSHVQDDFDPDALVQHRQVLRDFKHAILFNQFWRQLFFSNLYVLQCSYPHVYKFVNHLHNIIQQQLACVCVLIEDHVSTDIQDFIILPMI